MSEHWPEQLQQGLAAMKITASEAQQQQLLEYLRLLYKWNKAYNLTAIRDPAVAVRRQLLDSLSILGLLRAGKILDVGTGAGLPGLVLAIMRPELEFCLLDSNGKKIRFVRQVLIELGLNNVDAVQERIENYQPADRFDTITARAFASLDQMLDDNWRLLANNGLLLAMKGRTDTDTIRHLPEDSMAPEQVELIIPGETAQRHAVLIEKL